MGGSADAMDLLVLSHRLLQDAERGVSLLIAAHAQHQCQSHAHIRVCPASLWDQENTPWAGPGTQRCLHYCCDLGTWLHSTQIAALTRRRSLLLLTPLAPP